jgi:RHS repeat-associated protein
MKKLLRLILICALLVSTKLSALPYAGDDSDTGISRVDGFVDAYTGNLAFGTKDIVVAGAVGRYGLTWARHTTSRASQADYFFGQGHNWTHSWQWEMSVSGRDNLGRARITIREPRGWVYHYTEVSPNKWQAAPAVKNQLIPEGDDFILLLDNGCEVRFVRSQDSRGATFVAKVIKDIDGNAWQLAWESGFLVQVTEPAGRWLRVTYRTLVGPGGGLYTLIAEVSSSDGQAVTYDYSIPDGEDHPILSGARYPDATRAVYAYSAPRAGARRLLTQADDPRADQVIRGKMFFYRTEPDAAVGQISEIRTIKDGALFYALEEDLTQPGGRSYAVTLENGATVYRTFNPGGNLAQEIDALGFITKTDYDANGRGQKVSETDALGAVTRFERDANGYLTKITYADGSARSWERDARGRSLSETNELGHVRRYTYDHRGRSIWAQAPDGSVETMSYNDFGQVVTRRQHSGAVIQLTYDSRGLLIKRTDPAGGGTLYSYDSRDRCVATTDARGNITRFERDAVGRVIRTTYADGASHTTEYDSFGKVTRTVDAAGVEYRMIYDELGRLIEKIDRNGGSHRSEYAAVGTKAPVARPIKTISPAGIATTISYDAKGLVVARTIAGGAESGDTTRLVYDAAGRLITQVNPAGKAVQFVSDSRGRRIRTVSALNYATSVEYDAAGRKVSSTDAKGNITRWSYDSMGRELSKTDASGHTTSRQYDAAGRLIALVDAKGSVYRFEYDLAGRPTAFMYPDGSRESTVYDVAGLKIRSVNRAGVEQVFEYDNRNREIRSEWSDGSQTILKAYDLAGRLTVQDNGVSRLTFTYDELGRLASETQDISSVVTGGVSDPAAHTVRYTYNADGQRDVIGYPDGRFVQYSYDEKGRLAAVLGDGVQPPLASYVYDAVGNATRMPRDNATETEHEFDAENKAIAITERSGGTSLSQVDYLYDEVGNRSGTLATLTNEAVGAMSSTLDSYFYDRTYQITGADYMAEVNGDKVGKPAAKIRFNYDAVGNRAQVDENGVITRYTVNALNQYTKVGEFEPMYDRNGNLGGMGQWLYRYDALNRLISASNGLTTARFWYDARNRCVARSYVEIDAAGLPLKSSLAINYYDGWNLIAEHDVDGIQVARYVYGRRTDEIAVMTNRYGTFYPHYDVLGNVTMLTDRFGRLVERYSYSVSGQVSIADAAGQELLESRVGNRWMFTGREWLQEVRLYDYRNRVYSAELGRFLQTDPIRFEAGDVNIYRYCGNGFVNNIDPYGLDWWKAVSGIVKLHIGIAEIAIGTAIVVGTMGGGTLIGGLMITHGVWNYVDGAHDLWEYGQQQQSPPPVPPELTYHYDSYFDTTYNGYYVDLGFDQWGMWGE